MPAPYTARLSYSKYFQPVLLCAEVELGVKKAFIELTLFYSASGTNFITPYKSILFSIYTAAIWCRTQEQQEQVM